MNDEILQEMIRSSRNAEDVQDFVTRTGLELSSSELSAVAAVVDFRTAGLRKEAPAYRRAAFLGRVALQGIRGPDARRSFNPWIRRMAIAAAAVAALGLAVAVGANAERVTEAVGEAVGLRGPRVVTVPLRPVGPPPAQSGTAYLEENGGRTRVTLGIGNTDGIHPVHIHSGTCENLGGVRYNLAPAGPSDSLTGPSDADLRAGARLMDDVPATLSSLLTSEFAITAHNLPETFPNDKGRLSELLDDESHIVCGDIRR